MGPDASRLDHCPYQLREKSDQTKKSGGHSVFMIMQEHTGEGDGKKYENETEHNVPLNFFSNQRRRSSFNRFLEGLVYV